ncbi:hypothetical protein FE257_001041 [Aspergillus nanangensis]|uniref:Flavin-binding monooxygenase n=1 Tax=Aspergillus nanangensis TaxID=2582783 RepID=A0AAD4CTX6_ASPNN|nr:hypothetical protein FE257_001041 [Aspergillus nanangensis]
MAEFNAARRVGNLDFTRSTVVIIGAGISGLCMAIDLIRRTKCSNFVILEKGSQVGGTWNDNKYPGCACDVWSSLYSYSFEQKSDWTREYPGQEEILAYIIKVAEKYGLFKHIRFNSAVQEARWDDTNRRWNVKVGVSGAKDSQYLETYDLETEFLISAVGQLNAPSWPSISGLDDFSGKLMHSARWDWSYDFSGKRVAIIGNGASAVQIIPELAKSASHLSIYQRTPNWVIPRMDLAVHPIQQALLHYVPPVRWCKRAIMMYIREMTHSAFVDSNSLLSKQTHKQATDAMKSQLADKPELWETLTPNYAIGCKRILISDDFYPALNKEHVELNTTPIAKVTETGIETEDGDTREFDLIVVATGFRTVEFMYPIEVYGKNGRSVADVWKDGAMAYRGVTVEDLPNFGMLYGPNTNLGHNSIILMIEAQSRYLSEMVGAVVRSKTRGEALALTPKTDVVRRLNDTLQEQLQNTSFADVNCQSWYKQADGRITNNWPNTVVQYQKDLSYVTWADYEVEGADAEQIRQRKPTYIGRVKEESPVSNTTLVLGALGVAAVVGSYVNGRRRR